MNGAWKNAGEGAIDWTDFDEQTIDCVLHYLYTGDYHVHAYGSGDMVPITENEKETMGQTEGERGYSILLRSNVEL